MVTSEVPFEKKFCSGGINQIAGAHYHGQLLLGGWCCQASTRKLHLCSSALCCDAQLWSGQQFLHNNDGASVAIALQFPNVGAAGQSRPPASGSNRTHPWHHGHYTATHNNWGIMRVNIVRV